MPMGVLKKWLADKGFGFITPDDQSGDLFAHIRQKAGAAEEPINEGRRVYYESEFDAAKGKPKATTWYFEGGAAQAYGGITAPPPAVGVQSQLSAGGVDYTALVQAATAAAAAMVGGGQTNQAALLANLANLAGSTSAGGATVPTPPPPPLPPAAPQQSIEEVQVPASLMSHVVGQGGMNLEEIKKKVGGDIQIELGGGPADLGAPMRTLKVRGPPVSASLGACLLLQRVTEAM